MERSERRAIAISGIVQGVGFRPFVFLLATRFGLRGFVRNRTSGVLIEVEGDPRALDDFARALVASPPPLARIASVEETPIAPRGEADFRIEESEADSAGAAVIAPDAATCEACLREVLDPAGRRHGYPFTNCASCGPRLTIVTGAPYDRARTTMAGFAPCARCRAEYEDPRDRRFHAQPIACPACGPRLTVLDARGSRVATMDPIAHTAGALRAGLIAAIKGLGGFHLACAAANEAAVESLRRRKRRERKPFAIMVADLAAAEALCAVSPAERALLESPARPIVLLRRRPGAPIAGAVAPGARDLGVMLPYTPLHHLLLRATGAPLVMTSGNRTDEPIAIDDDDALARLAGIADLFVVHDRPIRTRCDDSVARVSDGAPLPIRRSRGYAPAPLALDPPLRVPTLAAGGELKATFALGAERRAFLSQHVGDLEHPAALRAYMDGIAHYERLFGIAPRRIVHDLHPDYAASHYALARSREAHLECLPVQHHHAHFASCLAEHGERGPAIGVAFDGTGYGLDGAIWGGEFLVGGAREVRRAAHLAYVALPGGDRATREPWRTAVAHLAAAGLDPLASAIAGRVPGAALGTVLRMIERRFQAPPTSSVGRLFDAAAAIAGVCDAVSFEGEAAMRLEALAAEAAADGGYPFEVREACPRPGPAAAGRREAGDGPMIVDPGPLVRALVRDLARGVAVPTAARRFHATLAEMIEEVCRRLRERTGLGTVCLSGGVFVNAILAEDAAARLARAGFRVLRHRLVPPNDGGLALGQLAVAAARDAASDG